MEKKWRRYFWPRWRLRQRIRRQGSGVQLLLSAAFGLVLAVLLLSFLDSKARPVIAVMAESRVENIVTGIIETEISKTLAQEAVVYDDIITFRTDSSGRITAFTSNSAEMNRLRTELLSAVISQVDTLDTGTLGIPLGNLLPFSALAEKGPLLPVRIRSIGGADAAFEHVFTAEGINQTHHQIMLNLSVSLTLLIPGGALDTQVSAQVCVAETVLVGEVPDTYLSLPGQGS